MNLAPILRAALIANSHLADAAARAEAEIQQLTDARLALDGIQKDEPLYRAEILPGSPNIFGRCLLCWTPVRYLGLQEKLICDQCIDKASRRPRTPLLGTEDPRMRMPFRWPGQCGWSQREITR